MSRFDAPTLLLPLLALVACDAPATESAARREASAAPSAEASPTSPHDEAPTVTATALAATPTSAPEQAPEPSPAPAAGAPDPTMSTPPAFEAIVPAETTVQTIGALSCPEGTRQTGGVHQEHSVLAVDAKSTYCIEWPVPFGAIPVRRGPSVWFHEDGTIAEQGHYEAGKRTGWWEKRHANGGVEALVHYASGEYDGDYFSWWENGKPQSEIQWRASKHHGISKTWGDDGSPLAFKRYEDDAVVETWIFDTDGRARTL